MDIFSELQTSLLSDLSISSSSSLFPLATRDSALNRAYIKISRMYRWPALEDAKKTSTVINKEYYDIPQGWSPDSVWRVEVNGEMYGEEPDGSPLAFDDYLDWKADNANSTLKKWAVQYTRYFISPTPTSVITNGISLWGQKNVATLSSASDTTIFSYKMPEINEAIVLEASAILRKKASNQKVGMLISQEAKEIVTIAWSKIQQEQSKFQKNQPFFYVPDYFANTSSKSTTIGNF